MPIDGTCASAISENQKEYVAVLTVLYKKNSAVTGIEWNFFCHPWIQSWIRLGYGQISLETATHSL